MTPREQAYLAGFTEKCAEHGVDPEQLMKEAGLFDFLGRQVARGVSPASEWLGKAFGSRPLARYGRNLRRGVQFVDEGTELNALLRALGDDFTLPTSRQLVFSKDSPTSMRVVIPGGEVAAKTIPWEDAPAAVRSKMIGEGPDQVTWDVPTWNRGQMGLAAKGLQSAHTLGTGAGVAGAAGLGGLLGYLAGRPAAE